MTTPGELIEQNRKVTGISLDDLSQKTKIPAEGILDHEANQTEPTLGQMRRYERALKIPAGELVACAVRYGLYVPLNQLRSTEWWKVREAIDDLEHASMDREKKAWISQQH